MTRETRLQMGWNLDHSYARLPKIFFSHLGPTSVPAPKLIIFNQTLATMLGLQAEALQGEEGISILAGNQLPEGALPLAQAYAGHQFGHFALLGDGRALLLGEQITPAGQRFDIQLKGSGPTPYSRRGDGRAVLGPMLREYIISEGMYGLGIETTRSLGVVATGQAVMRDGYQPGGVLTRVAASHLRVGTFQYAAQRGSTEELQMLADYALARHFPQGRQADNPYLFLLTEVIKRQAKLVAKWQLVGFVHGVMNTDNMTISGETIDYGPCAFMDQYDPATVFSSIDVQGRYAYGNQPQMAGWNLARFAESLLPLLHGKEEQAIVLARQALLTFWELYQQYWLGGMRSKLGLGDEEQGDEGLVHNLLRMMHKYKADYTNTFRALTFDLLEEEVMFATAEFRQWYTEWQTRLSRQETGKILFHELMRKSNPALIPRNHLVEAALAAAVEKEDYTVLHRLLQVLANPYTHSSEQAAYSIVPAASNPYQTFCGT